MPKSSKTLQIRPDSSTPGITGSHAHLIEHLQRLPPYKFDPKLNATAEQIDLAGEVLRQNLLAVERYVVAMVRDIADHSWALRPDIQSIHNAFDDMRGEIGGSIDLAAKTVEEEDAALFGRWRAA